MDRESVEREGMCRERDEWRERGCGQTYREQCVGWRGSIDWDWEGEGFGPRAACLPHTLARAQMSDSVAPLCLFGLPTTLPRGAHVGGGNCFHPKGLRLGFNSLQTHTYRKHTHLQKHTHTENTHPHAQ